MSAASIILATNSEHPELTRSDRYLAQQLQRVGIAVQVRPWDQIDPAALQDAVVCLRSPWDYHRRVAAFFTWLDGFTAQPQRLWNPLETVRWNADKIYFRELQAAGIALPVCDWFGHGERVDIAAFCRQHNCPQAVIKPRISATAYATYRVAAEQDLSDQQWADLPACGSLIQAFVPEVADAGEWSLMYFGDEYSHAVLKRAAAGDFRVQAEFGGSVTHCEAADELRDFADRVLAAVPHPWLYARVDLVAAAQGPLLMEVELIEPELFLGPASAGRMASALLTALAAA